MCLSMCVGDMRAERSQRKEMLQLERLPVHLWTEGLNTYSLSTADRHAVSAETYLETAVFSARSG